jgi:hypothetical protein
VRKGLDGYRLFGLKNRETLIFFHFSTFLFGSVVALPKFMDERSKDALLEHYSPFFSFEIKKGEKCKL